jgi:hypothetical protein
MRFRDEPSMLNPFQRSGDPYMLIVGMTGVKMGDSVALIGCAEGGRMTAVAAKVGLSGRAVAIVPDQASAARARKGAAQAGVLVEIEIAPPTHLPADEASFDLAVVDDTDGLLGTLRAEDRVATIRELQYSAAGRPRGDSRRRAAQLGWARC